MPRHCTVCAHPDREALEESLLTTETRRAIGRRFAVHEDAVGRHAANHLAGDVSAGVAVTPTTSVRVPAETDPMSDDFDIEEYDGATGTVRPVYHAPATSKPETR